MSKKIVFISIPLFPFSLLSLCASAVIFFSAPLQARQPAVAGQFYPGDKAELAAFVDKALAAPGPARPKGDIVAIIAPHAGYVYSGLAAGLAYKYIADSYDTVVILATGHTEQVKGAALLVGDSYETPLGKVETDEALAAALLKASPLFEARNGAHTREHAVEVQLPFLQRRLKKPFKVLAATLNSSDLENIRQVGVALAAALKGKRVLIVISTDLSHYPSAEVAAVTDGAIALAIETMDPAQVWTAAKMMTDKRVKGLDTCACGEAAIEAGLEAARLLGARSFAKLKLTESHAEFPQGSSPDRVVGYLSGLFVKGGAPAAHPLTDGQKRRLLEEARRTLEFAFAGKPQPTGFDPDPRLNLPGAAFVTLTEAGQLRGCIGTVTPMLTLADAVRYGAFSAAFRDGRFEPLKEEELPKVKVEVSVLSPLSPIKADSIVQHRHGVVVRKGDKSGLFLPQVWEQIPSKEAFLGELCAQKAGLPRDCWKDKAVQLFSFTVDSVTE